MSYYKMKCAYCARTLTNSDVVYKLATEELYHAQQGSKSNSTTDTDDSFDVMNGMDEMDTAMGVSGEDGGYVSGETLEEK